MESSLSSALPEGLARPFPLALPRLYNARQTKLSTRETWDGTG